MREKYESLSLATLKDLAKARGLKGVSALRKPELIERMLHEDELENASKSQETMQEKPQQENISDSAGVNEEPQQYARPQQYIRPQPYIRQQDPHRSH